MAKETWLTGAELVRLIAKRHKTSIGEAEWLVKEARASGKVRPEEPQEPVYYLPEDGLIDFDQTPGAKNPGGVTLPAGRLSKDDLLYWLDQKFPVETEAGGDRYDGDEKLVAEGVEGRRSRKWRSAREAAIALAPRAQGASFDAKVDRLRKKIADQVGD